MIVTWANHGLLTLGKRGKKAVRSLTAKDFSGRQTFELITLSLRAQRAVFSIPSI